MQICQNHCAPHLQSKQCPQILSPAQSSSASGSQCPICAPMTSEDVRILSCFTHGMATHSHPMISGPILDDRGIGLYRRYQGSHFGQVWPGDLWPSMSKHLHPRPTQARRIRGSRLVDRPAQLPNLQLTGTAKHTLVDATLARANNLSRAMALSGPDGSRLVICFLMYTFYLNGITAAPPAIKASCGGATPLSLLVLV